MLLNKVSHWYSLTIIIEQSNKGLLQNVQKYHDQTYANFRKNIIKIMSTDLIFDGSCEQSNSK